MKKHLNIEIFGKVQGVFFRDEAKRKAEKLDLVGFAKNTEENSVYIEAEGEEKALDEFLKWCQTGPALAKVKKTQSNESPLKNFSSFEIKF